MTEKRQTVNERVLSIIKMPAVEQFDLASKVAENVGYILVKESEDSEDIVALREIEAEWLVEKLSTAIASLAYPVGCGSAPTYKHLKFAADSLFDRYAKMIQMATKPTTNITQNITEPVTACPTCPEGCRPLDKEHCGDCYEGQIERLRDELAVAGAIMTHAVDEYPVASGKIIIDGQAGYGSLREMRLFLAAVRQASTPGLVGG